MFFLTVFSHILSLFHTHTDTHILRERERETLRRLIKSSYSSYLSLSLSLSLSIRKRTYSFVSNVELCPAYELSGVFGFGQQRGRIFRFYFFSALNKAARSQQEVNEHKKAYPERMCQCASACKQSASRCMLVCLAATVRQGKGDYREFQANFCSSNNSLKQQLQPIERGFTLFVWQLRCLSTRQKQLPAGARLRVIAHTELLLLLHSQARFVGGIFQLLYHAPQAKQFLEYVCVCARACVCVS